MKTLTKAAFAAAALSILTAAAASPAQAAPTEIIATIRVPNPDPAGIAFEDFHVRLIEDVDIQDAYASLEGRNDDPVHGRIAGNADNPGYIWGLDPKDVAFASSHIGICFNGMPSAVATLPGTIEYYCPAGSYVTAITEA
ncbi:BP74-related protein [Phytomonospora endophytica]|uniref:BP74 N-terminal domain-containing protein n=1 Tax=Phytomonospora endophytica TaxID=714109 RepID=A0A841F9G8_9ACTN|nr:hypothetical protein [Phytomonospora endophytica]MBB6033831.1 hypothetical protein [Phytomonospora endophytica]GIG64650.1 hypothetical protein Pen01_09450 [Phytomonospora endophytica]